MVTAIIPRIELRLGLTLTAEPAEKCSWAGTLPSASACFVSLCRRQQAAGPTRIRHYISDMHCGSSTSFAPRLIQAQRGRYRYIDAFHRAVHRDADQPVAALTRKAPQPLAFRTEHPGERP